MASSKVTSLQQARRPRDPSDEFGAAGSLGSIGGSEVGSSVGTPSATAAATPATTATTSLPKSKIAAQPRTKPIETIEVKKKGPETPESLSTGTNEKRIKLEPTEFSKSSQNENVGESSVEEEMKRPLVEGTNGTKIKTELFVAKNGTKKSPPASSSAKAVPDKKETPEAVGNNNNKSSATKTAENSTITRPARSQSEETTESTKPLRIRMKKRKHSGQWKNDDSSSKNRKDENNILDVNNAAMPPMEIGSASWSYNANNNLRILPVPSPSIVDPLPSIHAALSSKNSSKILPSVSASLSAGGSANVTILPIPTLVTSVAASAAAASDPSSDVDNRSNGSGSNKILPHLDALPSMDSIPNMDLDAASPLRLRSESMVSINTQGRAALDHLDILGNEAKEAAAKFKLRKRSLSGENSNGSSSHETMNSQQNKYLVEALLDDGSHHSGGMGPRRSRLDSIGSKRDRVDSFEADFEEERLSTFHDDLRRERLNSTASDFDFSLRRERLNSSDFDFRRDRLNSLEMDFSLTQRDRIGSLDISGLKDDRKSSFDSHARREERKSSFDSHGRREERKSSFDSHGLREERKSSFDSQGKRERRGRNRCESWGGMSELSIPIDEPTVVDSLIGGGAGAPSSAVQLAASIYTSLANDLTAAANPDDNGSISSFLVNEEKIPSKISVQRDRQDSTTSNPSNSSEIGQFVKDAIESMGDTLAEIANAASEAAKDSDADAGSQASSVLTPVIGAASDHSSKVASAQQASVALSLNLDLAVDYDAVAAAVDAAEAASGAIDLSSFVQSSSVSSDHKPGSAKSSSKTKVKRQRSQLTGDILGADDGGKAASESTSDGNVLQVMERARAAAGYVPPRKGSGSIPLPPKKKAKLETPGKPLTNSTAATPKIRNLSKETAAEKATIHAQNVPGAPIKATPPTKGQSSQKWDNMFDCLLSFIAERKQEETPNMSEEDKKDWIWDGNVPTTFKTKDGKALGRWVNNQRSAKSKGVLKEERERRLVDAGLKWSVLASNSWSQMLEELRIYVAEQTRVGKKWDGNVPTNYRIKTRVPTTSKDDEDKNLGRWVNRQRSLFSAGKLRKDRQKALEEVGLKWSMLATTSWESMFETLGEYVAAKTKDGNVWDGNVPANYKTNDDPPRALGRWINRQRSAYGKEKLKPECVAKLNKIGLKWSVHERRPAVSANSAANRNNKSLPSSVAPGVTVSMNATSIAPPSGAATSARATAPKPSSTPTAPTGSIALKVSFPASVAPGATVSMNATSTAPPSGAATSARATAPKPSSTPTAPTGSIAPKVSFPASVAPGATVSINATSTAPPSGAATSARATAPKPSSAPTAPTGSVALKVSSAPAAAPIASIARKVSSIPGTAAFSAAAPQHSSASATATVAPKSSSVSVTAAASSTAAVAVASSSTVAKSSLTHTAVTTAAVAVTTPVRSGAPNNLVLKHAVNIETNQKTTAAAAVASSSTVAKSSLTPTVVTTAAAAVTAPVRSGAPNNLVLKQAVKIETNQCEKPVARHDAKPDIKVNNEPKKEGGCDRNGKPKQEEVKSPSKDSEQGEKPDVKQGEKSVVHKATQPDVKVEKEPSDEESKPVPKNAQTAGKTNSGAKPTPAIPVISHTTSKTGNEKTGDGQKEAKAKGGDTPTPKVSGSSKTSESQPVKAEPIVKLDKKEP